MKRIFAFLCILLGAWSVKVEAQAQSVITESLVADDVSGIDIQNGVYKLYPCVYEYTFHVSVSIPQNSPGVTIVHNFPDGLEFDEPTSGSGTLPSHEWSQGNTNELQFTGVTESFEYDVKLKSACNINSENGNENEQYSSSFTVDEGSAFQIISQVTYQILNPVAYFDNSSLSYTNAAGDPIGTLAPGPVQLLYKRNSTSDSYFFRTFDIKISDGRVGYAELAYTPEYEINPVELRFFNGNNFDPGAPNPYSNPLFTVGNLSNAESNIVQIDPLTILSQERNYFKQGDVIKVVEVFYVKECTLTDPAPDLQGDTKYKFRIFCRDNENGGINELCNEVTKSFAVKVTNSNTYFEMVLSYSDTLDICGNEPTDISFTFKNPQHADDNTAYTGIKKFEDITFPFDLIAFDAGDEQSIGNAVIEYNGVEISINDINSYIQPVQFLTFSNDNSKYCTLHIDALNNLGENSSFGTLWNGSSPFGNWYNTDNYTDVMEGESFTLKFKNMRFNYDHAFVRPQGTLLSECGHTGNYLLYGLYNVANTHYNYYKMCEVESLTITNADNWPDEFLDYTNNFPVTGFAEAESADVISGNGPVGVDFYFSSTAPAGSTPWNYNHAMGASENKFFYCPDLSYHVEIILPDNMVIPGNNGDITVNYYPNPNDPATFVVLQLANTTINANSTVSYNFLLVDMEGVPVTDLHGMVSANIQLIPCNNAEFGISDIVCKVKSICNADCPEKYNAVACFSTKLHWRCSGPCCGPPQGTSNFSFNRITPGFTDATMTQHVNLDVSDPLIKLNRAYPCDLIEVKSDGQIYQALALCTDQNNTYPIPAADQFYFQIQYESPVNFQFFDFVNASFTAITGDGSVVPINPPTGFHDNVNGNLHTLLFKIEPQSLTPLQSYAPLSISFFATLKVNDMLVNNLNPDNSNNSYFQLPQIRGQFVSGGTTDWLIDNLSCDDHGDNMTILNVRTKVIDSNRIVLKDGGGNEEYNWDNVDNGICNRRFQFNSKVVGGLIGIDEFPHEFRPIMLWPAPGDATQIQFTVPQGFHFNQPSINFRAKDRIGWTPVSSVITEDQGNQTIKFFGTIGDNDVANPWPIFEHDGTQLWFEIMGKLENDCPPEEDVMAGPLILPHTKRAYASDEGCKNYVDTVARAVPIPHSDYTLTISTNNETFSTSLNTGTISGLSVHFDSENKPEGVLTSNLENFWIENLSSQNILINSITITSGSNNVTTTATLEDGFYHLGVLYRGISTISINYTLLNCTAGEDLELLLKYGFSCAGYPSNLVQDPDDAIPECKTGFVSPIIIHPEQSSLSFGAGLSETPISSPCTAFEYVLTFSTTSPSEVNNILLNVTNIPSEFNYVSGNWTLAGSTPEQLPAPTLSGTNLVWNISNDLLDNEGLVNGALLELHIFFTGNCSMWNTTQNLTFEATGSDICANAISVNGSPATVQANFPSFNWANNTCSDCFSCDGFDFNYLAQTGCDILFNAIFDSDPYSSGSEFIWDFGDGTTATGQNVIHQFVATGYYTVTCTWNRYDDVGNIVLTCTHTEQIYAACCEGVYMDIDYNSYGPCTIGYSANFPTNPDCVNSIVTWNFGDGNTATGLNVSHQYVIEGNYAVSFTVDCINDLGNILSTCETSQNIYVKCDSVFCDDLSLNYSQDNNCITNFTASVPNYPNCFSTTYSWNFGDNSPLVNGGPNVSHQYASSGNYQVCYKWACYDSSGNLLNTCETCKDIYVECDTISCDGFSLSYSQGNNCITNFTASVPNYPNCFSTTYSWNFGDNSPLVNGGPNVSHQYASSGNYQVCYKWACYDSSGNLLNTCKTCKDIYVECDTTEVDCEQLSFTYSQSNSCEVSFQPVVPSGAGCAFSTFMWYFGDGTTSNLPTPVHTYPASGTYMVSLVWICYDVAGNVINTCNIRKEIEVNCEQESLICLEIDNTGNKDIGESIISTPDGGCAVAGTMFKSSISSDNDMYVVKYNNQLDFNTATGARIGGDLKEQGYSLMYKNHDGYYVAGTVNVSESDKDIYVAKLSQSGAFLWGYRYGYANGKIEEARKIIDMSTATESAILVVGFTNSGTSYNKALALKISPNGDVVSVNTYLASDSTAEMVNDVAGWTDAFGKNYYYLVGEHKGNDGSDGFVIKIDQNLHLVSSKLIDNINMQTIANSVAVLPGVEKAAVFIVGSIAKNEDRIRNIYIVRLDDGLTPLSTNNNVFLNSGNNRHEFARKVKITSDKNLIIAGESSNLAGEKNASIILKVSSVNLSVIWSRISNGSEKFYRDITQLSDNKYVATGANKITASDYDILVSELSPDGKSCCVSEIVLKKNAALKLNNYFKERNITLEKLMYGSVKKYYKEKVICKDLVPTGISVTPVNTRQIPAFKGDDINIFPNPNTGEFVIELSNTTYKLHSIRLYDISGRLISTYSEMPDKRFRFYCSEKGLNSGMYIIEVSNAEHKWKSKVIISK